MKTTKSHMGDEFRVLYENSPDMYVSVSPDDANIKQCNETLLKKTGYLREELIGFPIYKMYHEDCMDEVKEVFQQFVDTGVVVDKELILARKDGSKIDVSLNVNPVRDKTGRILHSISSWRDITDRKRPERELARAFDIINQSPVVAIQWKNDKGWPVAFASENISDLFGYSAEEFVSGKANYAELIHPDDHERVKKEVHDAIKDRKNDSFIHKPYRINSKTKGSRWIEDRTTIVREANEGIAYFQGIIFDITDKIEFEAEKKKSRDALQESEERYRTMIETSNDMIWALDLEGKFVFINQNAEEKTEFKAEEWIGKSFIPLVLEEELPMIMDVFQKGLEGASSSYLMHFKKENGEVLALSVNTTPIKKDNEIKELVNFARDITVDLQLQEKIQSYQKLFEDSRNEIYFFHIDTYKFFDVNKAALDNLGFTEDEMYGMTPYDIKPECNKKDFHKLVQNLKNKTKEALTFTAIHERKDGSTYPVEVNLQLSSYGDISAFVAIIIDITDRVKAEDILRIHRDQLEETVIQRTQEIEKQSKKLEESQLALTFLLEDMNLAREKREETNIKLIDANKDLESFSYSVSHDLRAPLRAIVGFSAKFNSQYNTIIDDEGKRLLDVISKNAMKMGRLIDDLLAFSRMSRTEIRKLKVNMRSLADEAWMEVAEQASDRNIQIEFKALPDLKGDRNMLKQVYVNLFSNAIKFSKPAEQNVIEVGADLEDGKCIFYVKDNGVGFDMKYIGKLFQVFQRLHSEKEFEGTGVGLALVHRIIKKHEGEIWAESELYKGAKFSFILPA